MVGAVNKNRDLGDWGGEFDSFMGAPEVTPPLEVTERIRAIVHSDLNPSSWRVLRKLALIHGFVGSLSLLVCAQFGVGTGTSLVYSFTQFGASACMGLCGAFFLGLTALIASFALSRSEFRFIRKTGYSPFAVLGFLSLIVFLALGANLIFGLMLIWLFGGVLGSLFVGEIGWRMRSLLLR
jgi:hypothetical protein